MANLNFDVEKFLSDKRVVAEIERHLWLESEKLGYDIGFEKAREDWLKNFSKAWMQYHMPETYIEARKAERKAESAGRTKAEVRTPIKRRRAKAYV